MLASPEVTRALERLRSNADFNLVIEWIKSEQDGQVDVLLDCTNQVIVHQAQGYARALRDILKAAMPEPRPA